MAQGHKFQDLEETGEALVAFINSSQPDTLRQVKAEHRALFDRHTETRRIVTQILKGEDADVWWSQMAACHRSSRVSRCCSGRGGCRSEAAGHGGGEAPQGQGAEEHGGAAKQAHSQKPDHRFRNTVSFHHFFFHITEKLCIFKFLVY